MTDPTARQGDAAAAETENGQGNGAPMQDPPAEAVTADPLAEARREAAEYKDKLLRTLAEMENLRRRTEREVTDARLYGIASFARDVLAVADNMHRALEAIGPRAARACRCQGESADRGRRAHRARAAEGAGEARREEVLARWREVRPQCAPGHVRDGESRDVPPGHVAQVIQAGYMIGDRVLRPALVAVAKAAKRGSRPRPTIIPAASPRRPSGGDPFQRLAIFALLAERCSPSLD